MTAPGLTIGSRHPTLRGSDWTLVLGRDLAVVRALDAAVRLGAPPEFQAEFLRMFHNAGEIGVHWLEVSGVAALPVRTLIVRVGSIAVYHSDVGGKGLPPLRLEQVLPGVPNESAVRLVLGPLGFVP